MGTTPLRQVRVPDTVWDHARARAEAQGTTLARVIRTHLESYAQGYTPAPHTHTVTYECTCTHGP